MANPQPQQNPQQKITRSVTPAQEKFLRILESIKYGRIENITIRDNAPRKFELVYQIDLDNLQDLKAKLEELSSISLTDD